MTSTVYALDSRVAQESQLKGFFSVTKEFIEDPEHFD